MEALSKAHLDEGEEKKMVVFGGQRVTSFIKDVAAGRFIDDKRYDFGEEFVMEVHDRVCMAPGVKGFLRQTDSTTVGGKPVVGPYQELDAKMHLFGRWFQEEMQNLKEDPEDLLGALRVAAASHYGIVMRSFHPFDNGNGRTARALMNSVLMSQSYELTAYGLAIPPLPILRTNKDAGRYIKALRCVDETKDLNSFMNFISHRWIENLDERLTKIEQKVKSPGILGDRLLIEKLDKRRHLLKEFGTHKDCKYQTFPVPDYFETRFIKINNENI